MSKRLMLPFTTACALLGGMANTANASDAQFVKAAYNAYATSVAASQLALKRNQTDTVQMLANTLISDHGKALVTLRSLAQKDGLGVDLPSGDAAVPPSLGQANDHDFAKSFSALSINEHQTLISLLETEAAQGTHKNLKDFASQNLPVEKSHLAGSQEIQNKH